MSLLAARLRAGEPKAAAQDRLLDDISFGILLICLRDAFDGAAPWHRFDFGGLLLATEHGEYESLLIAVAQRDRSAFRTLYDLASPKLYATILRIVRSKPAAEEVLQDVFLRIWQKAESFSPDAGPARAWMNSIARNRAIDVLRQKSFVALSGSEDGGDVYERIAEERDREADMVNNASLRHCLDTIEEPARVCVLLAYYEGYSREELAQRYERPVNTIKTWLHRSLATLRVCLDGAA